MSECFLFAMTVTGWPMGTIIRGNVVIREGELTNEAGGAPVRFQETGS